MNGRDEMTASSPPPAPSESAIPAPRFRINIRVIALLAVLTAVICGAVLLTDRFSPRERKLPAAIAATHADTSTGHRQDADATFPATGAATTKGVLP
jgi:hypothetical protein